EEKYKMSHASVLSFVTRYKIPRITQGRTVYYSRAHIDTIKGERESIDPNYYTYAEIMDKTINLWTWQLKDEFLQ
ncbi:MAG: hypothetical protein II541_12065, partial [Prevotella sp.]|nr:hypothetical protein [Prevotella sp.]